MRARTWENDDLSMLEDDKTTLIYMLHIANELVRTMGFKLEHFKICDIVSELDLLPKLNGEQHFDVQ